MTVKDAALICGIALMATVLLGGCIKASMWASDQVPARYSYLISVAVVLIGTTAVMFGVIVSAVEVAK